MNKNFLKCLVTLSVFLMILGVSIKTNDVFATTKEDSFTVNNSKVNKFSDETSFDGPDNIISKQSTEKQINELIKEAKKDYNKASASTLYNTTSTDTYTSKPSKKKPVNHVEIVSDITYDSSENKIFLKSTITKITGAKPYIVLTGIQLNKSKEYNGTFKKVTGFDVEWKGKDIRVGKSKTKSYKVTSTNFWITKSKQTVGWSGAKPITKTIQKSAKLANKKASLYPKIKNDHNRVTMPTPKIADMEIVPKKDRVKWTSTNRKNYKKAYIKKYGDPKIDWSGDSTEIHHVVPREYGGTNKFENLFPLPVRIHRSTVNTWWKNY